MALRCSNPRRPPTRVAGATAAAPRWWFSGNYMLTFVSNQPIPYTMLTTSSPNQNGLIGAPTTLPLITNQNIRYSAISGFQLDTGFYGDADRRWGAEVSAFYTERLNYQRGYTSVTPGFDPAGIPLLARPFIDSTTGAPSSLVLANAGLGAGNAVLTTHTEVHDIDASGVWNVFRCSPGSRFWWSLDVMGGYQFFQLREDIAMGSTVSLNNVLVIPILRPGPFGVPIQVGTRVAAIPVPVGGVFTGAPATVSIVDKFAVTNQFNGGFVGMRTEARCGMFSVTTTGKLGVGEMHEVLDITGGTSFVNTATAQAGSSYGGLYANSSNIGHFATDRFAIIPELNVNFGVNITRSFSAYVGYGFLFVNRVARPGDQMNPVIDSSTVPFSSSFGDFGHTPQINTLFKQSQFWMNMVNFGFEYKY